MTSVFDQFYLDVLGVDELPEGDWVLPVLYGDKTGMWVYRAVNPSTGNTIVTGWVKTEEDGWKVIQARHDHRMSQ